MKAPFTIRYLTEAQTQSIFEMLIDVMAICDSSKEQAAALASITTTVQIMLDISDEGKAKVFSDIFRLSEYVDDLIKGGDENDDID